MGEPRGATRQLGRVRLRVVCSFLLGLAALLALTGSADAGQIVETYDAYANDGVGESVASGVTSFTLDNVV